MPDDAIKEKKTIAYFRELGFDVDANLEELIDPETRSLLEKAERDGYRDNRHAMVTVILRGEETAEPYLRQSTEHIASYMRNYVIPRYQRDSFVVDMEKLSQLEENIVRLVFVVLKRITP
jgi:hypothetical protein